ncbi:cytochrome c oxidase assembly protein COX20, mitochondrial isoform X2 [Tachysurus fulvidraco]|uniref:cytochrome c oxidase assembly protein COX20, mitochondrial isoform X2 n=1 Tax=Tachysurus fulvidraco TaxID=1234273 RepID=UPI000F5106C6|nr:cytochrome c oxidase assembly protein COX20, mitochondrial isoform X2 [Tachysurus fulvidraco]
MAEQEPGSKNQGVKLLGILDVEKTPCAREAILHGAGGSAVAGLVHFLATSRVKRSFHAGMAGFMITTMASWCVIPHLKRSVIFSSCSTVGITMPDCGYSRR